jgi:hypothetical protein
MRGLDVQCSRLVVHGRSFDDWLGRNTLRNGMEPGLRRRRNLSRRESRRRFLGRCRKAGGNTRID